MSFTNSTTNYHLPQYINTDIPSYLVDQNGAWQTIDTYLKAASDVADAAKTKADNNETAIAGVNTTATTANGKATGSLANEADAYVATTTYEVGDLVIYNNILYRCTTAITIPEAFDSSHWTVTTIETEINTVKNDVPSRFTSASKLISLTANNPVTVTFDMSDFNLDVSKTIYFANVTVGSGSAVYNDVNVGYSVSSTTNTITARVVSLSNRNDVIVAARILTN